MTDGDASTPISQKVHDAAADWFARRERSHDSATEAAFAAWLAEDAAHRLAYDEVERNWRDGLLLADSKVGHDRELGKAPFLLRRQTHVAAAGLAMLALVGIVASGVLPSGPFSVVGEAKAAVYQTGVGEIRTVSLADGSKVTLDTQSRVDLPAASNPRRVRLVRGRARFDVVPRQNEPFVVAADQAEIIAAGDTFDVGLSASGAKVVSLRGAVKVQLIGHGAAEARTLEAGQQTMMIPGKGVAAPVPAGPSEARWVSGMLALDAVRLGDAVAAINRYNRVQVRLADPGLAPRAISGAFRATDPEGFAAAVAAMFHLRIVRQQGAILLAPADRS